MTATDRPNHVLALIYGAASGAIMGFFLGVLLGAWLS